MHPSSFRWTKAVDGKIEGVAAIDRKTIRRSKDGSKGNRSSHVVSVWTSGGSGIRGSLTNVNRYCAGASVLSGRDLTGANADTVKSWLASIGVLQ